MELYHNQVTRVQGAFSLRMFHRSWGIMMMQENISAPSTVLDFPTRDAFAKELTARHYDVVGISSIIVNIGKVREMCRMVRQLSPASTIVVGGHVAAIPGIEHMIDADHIVRGDGISWLRRFPRRGHDRAYPPSAYCFGLRCPSDGNQDAHPAGDTAATIIPSVGCPLGCNFCTTSAFFGGKGKFLNFYQTGEELFRVMCEMEASMKVRSFFMMDENFLLHRSRAMELLELMKAEGQGLGAVRFLVGTRHQQIQPEGTGGTGRFLDLDGARVAALPLRQTAGPRYPGAHTRIAAAWRSSCWARPSWGWNTIRPENIARRD